MSSFSILALIMGVFATVFFFLLKKAISCAKKQSELENEIEDSRHAIDIQKEYENISSRLQSDADDILDRMRTDPSANK